MLSCNLALITLGSLLSLINALRVGLMDISSTESHDKIASHVCMYDIITVYPFKDHEAQFYVLGKVVGKCGPYSIAPVTQDTEESDEEGTAREVVYYRSVLRSKFTESGRLPSLNKAPNTAVVDFTDTKSHASSLLILYYATTDSPSAVELKRMMLSIVGTVQNTRKSVDLAIAFCIGCKDITHDLKVKSVGAKIYESEEVGSAVIVLDNYAHVLKQVRIRKLKDQSILEADYHFVRNAPKNSITKTGRMTNAFTNNNQSLASSETKIQVYRIGDAERSLKEIQAAVVVPEKVKEKKRASGAETTEASSGKKTEYSNLTTIKIQRKRKAKKYVGEDEDDEEEDEAETGNLDEDDTDFVINDKDMEEADDEEEQLASHLKRTKYY